ncbi:secretion protein EspG [Mycobacterium kyorinense]|uniref:Secretion protein EspG n=1 Tax=Mycobacterium kyorinense TaxID=487514 RepID=A0A1A2ZTQ4_9MYCO|nr:ESX secretion-associated protein EspG [Mycobacterium kyorinense]OBI53685.1 secretion protein EspG [Mycobacterium kyorinense]
MLTTTLDGLWVLQVLTGVEVIAPELGLRPHLPSVEPRQLALAHPIADELRAHGVIDESGAVDNTVVEWLTVLSRRDMALLMQLRSPHDVESARVLLARCGQWWVVMERSASSIRIHGAGTTSAADTGEALISAQIERLCGCRPAAPLRPVTVDAAVMRAEAPNQDALWRFLAAQHLDADQQQILKWAGDSKRSAQVSIVAIHTDTGRLTRSRIDDSAVTIIDTPEGRLLAEHVVAAGKSWLIVAPGTTPAIGSAVKAMVQGLPTHEGWYSHRQVG